MADAQTVFENGVAKNIFDPNRNYLENVKELMIAAGTTGATLRGGLEIIAKVHAGANPTTLAQTQGMFRALESLSSGSSSFSSSFSSSSSSLASAAVLRRKIS